MQTTKRDIQKEQTRDRLLSVAYRAFACQGLLLTKTSDIAHAAGIAHGTLFVHFPTRDDLLLCVVEEFGLTLGGRLQALAQGEVYLQEVLMAHLMVIEEFEPFYAHLIIEGPLLAEKIRTAIFMIQSGIASHIERAYNYELHEKQKKTIKNFPLHILLNTWLGLVHHYLINRDVFAPHASVIERHGKELLSNFLIMITD